MLASVSDLAKKTPGFIDKMPLFLPGLLKPEQPLKNYDNMSLKWFKIIRFIGINEVDLRTSKFI